jgi:nucleoside-diphosphate-sugar epimerase
VNVNSTLYLLDTLKNQSKQASILVVGSAAQYGYVENTDVPIPESYPTNAESLYGYSKNAQEKIACHYAEKSDMNVVCVRLSNIICAGLPERFFPGTLVKQLIEIKQQKKKTLRLRNLTSGRDYVNIRDVVTAYDLLLSNIQSKGKVFNISSGIVSLVKDHIKLVQNLLELNDNQFSIKLTGKEPPYNRSIHSLNNQEMKTFSEWKPEISLEKSYKEMLDFY